MFAAYFWKNAARHNGRYYIHSVAGVYAYAGVCVYIYIYNVIKCFGNCRKTGFTGGNTADTFVSRAVIYTNITRALYRYPSPPIYRSSPRRRICIRWVNARPNGRRRHNAYVVTRAPGCWFYSVDGVRCTHTGGWRREGRDDLGRPSGKTTAIHVAVTIGAGGGRNYVKTAQIERKNKINLLFSASRRGTRTDSVRDVFLLM